MCDCVCRCVLVCSFVCLFVNVLSLSCEDVQCMCMPVGTREHESMFVAIASVSFSFFFFFFFFSSCAPRNVVGFFYRFVCFSLFYLSRCLSLNPLYPLFSIISTFIDRFNCVPLVLCIITHYFVAVVVVIR